MSTRRIESVRTKRRKIMKEISDVEEMLSHSNSLEYEPPENVLEINNLNLMPLFKYDNLTSSSKNQYNISNEFPSNASTNLPLPVINTYNEPTDTHIFNKDKLFINSSKQFSVQEFLASWAIDYKIPHNAVNGLLKGLKMHDCFNNLPIDCRTILNTPINKSKENRIVSPGVYHHFGLEKGIKLYAPSNVQDIQIVIGIDGLPISKSSSSQFWPILASILVKPPLKKSVFIVGLYWGIEKPKDSNEYLIDFVNEAKRLETEGIILNGINIKVNITLFCCDAPAKAFVLKVKGHTGFYSCTRCTIEGEYVCNRVCFPYSQTKSIERNHHAYLNTEDEEYQISNQTSILVELQSFNSVKSFSLDYMHLVCLGVCKKLISLWIKGPLNVRLRSSKINEISTLLLASNTYLSSDFSRKNRCLPDVCRWKATEFRLFLLYTGPVVLKTILSEEMYTNFMVLNIAMLILLSPDRKFLLQYARELLDFFVKNFQHIYGQQFVSHNVHALLHLCDDYDLFGPLDNCSAFGFENYMKEIKSNLRKNEKPLEQIVNRYYEKYEKCALNNSSNKSLMDNQPVLKHVHDNGPLVDDLIGPQYYTLIFKSLTIKIKKESDSFILTKNGEIVKCMNFAQKDGIIMLIGKKFNILLPYFVDPINSTIIEIFEIKNLSDQLKHWAISDIKKKMMIFHHSGKKIAMPIIHTDI